MSTATPFVHRIRVRYGECDMQGVVFNAHYVSYLDDVMDQWLVHALGKDYLSGFEYAVKKVSVEWSSSATVGDLIDITPRPVRWGRTSVVIGMELRVGDRQVATAELVAVGVKPGTHEPTPISDEVRAALSDDR